MINEQKKYSYKLTRSGWFLIIMIVIVLFLLSWFVFLKPGIIETSFDGYQSKWQAVFLTSGEIYFGEMVEENDYYVYLKNIYYLKEKNNLHQSNEASHNQDFSLIKFGKEVHQPLDGMKISRYQVLYIEDLAKESKIVGAIKDYENKNTEVLDKVK